MQDEVTCLPPSEVLAPLRQVTFFVPTLGDRCTLFAYNIRTKENDDLVLVLDR